MKRKRVCRSLICSLCFTIGFFDSSAFHSDCDKIRPQTCFINPEKLNDSGFFLNFSFTERFPVQCETELDLLVTDIDGVNYAV